MKQFFVRLFAVIGLILTLGIATGGLLTWSWLTSEGPEEKAPEKIVLSLDLTAPVGEAIMDFDASLPALVYGDEGKTPIIYILRALENAKKDPKVKGVVAFFGTEPLHLSQAQEIAAAIDNFRQSGKFTYIYAPSYGGFGSSNTFYYLASHFENVWMQPVGTIGLSGLGMEAPFGKTALAKLGIETDFMRREEYKSVMENVSQDAFSPTVKANMTSMMESLSQQIAKGIADGRKIEIAKANELIANGPFTSNEAVKNNLITRLGYEDELEKELDDKAGKDSEYLQPADYLYYHYKGYKDEAKGEIAVIYAEGLITDDPPRGPASLAEEEIIDTDSIVDAFEEAAKDDKVKAILFRVNSPGGSPVASETIRRALVKAKESKKPVFVSMGQVAASGGYWISMNADRIIANPATITGSIGVVAGKFVLGGLFDKLGIKWDGMSTSDNAMLWSTRSPFNAKARERMNAMLDETYKTFTDSVAAARKIAPEKMGDVAKGRVFTGEQALQVGLVDELGGLETAVVALKKELKFAPEDRVMLKQFPAPETPETLIMRMLQNLGLVSAMLHNSWGDWVKIRSSFAPILQALSSAKDPVSARLPSYFIYD